MKVTYNWLKDFVEIKIPAGKLADKLTMAGLEVTSLEEKEGDAVFEIEVTSNRPDCLSVIGIAREVAAITNKKIKIPALTYSPESKVYNNRKEKICGLSAIGYRLFSIKIEDKRDCPLYIARIIRNLKVGPSPSWLKKRLELVGCRSINNVVDITNYVLFELGEPLHGFDLDKLAKKPEAIFVRRAKNAEIITTIDGEEKSLDAKMLVIADGEKPVAVAGVMGGRNTEVSGSTKNILLEAAVFDPITVRHARQRLGLQSESAYRFERGIDPGIVECASRRAARLLAELAGGECVLAKGRGKPNLKKKKLSLNMPRSNKILGINISSAAAKKILLGLGFQATSKGKTAIAVGIPSYRGDVKAEIDLIEELARIYGFDRIPTTLPSLRAGIIPDKSRGLVSTVKNTLIGLGLSEVITYSLIDKGWLQKEAIGILNPLSKEQEFLRPQLTPSLVACVSRNLNYKQDCINIFEVAKAFCPEAAGPKEELMLAVALCGMKSYLFGQGLVKERFGPLHLKGVLEVLFERLGITNCGFTREGPSKIGIYAGADKIGEMLCLEEGFLDKLEIKNKEVVAAEVSLERLFSHTRPVKSFAPPPKFPGITRDISLVLREDVPIEKVLQAALRNGRPLLREIKVTDYYKGKQISRECIGLTLSCFYRSDERTLNEAEVSPVHNLICGLLTQSFGATLR